MHGQKNIRLFDSVSEPLPSWIHN